MEFREAKLQELWRDMYPGKAIPSEIARLKSYECAIDARTVGHCTGDTTTGEIVGLAVDPAYRGRGIGKNLLALVVDALRVAGATRIWLAAPSDPSSRAYGFYRAVGWTSTGDRTRDGSEILELR